MNVKVPHLQTRGRRHRYRRNVPADLRDRVGKVEWLQALGRDETAAIRECRRLTLVHDALILRLRGKGGDDVADTKVIAAAEAEAQGLLAAGDAAIDAAVAGYIDDALTAWIETNIAGKRPPGALKTVGGKPVIILDPKRPSPASKPGPQLSPFHKTVINAVGHGGRYIPSTVTIADAYQRDLQLYGEERKDERPVALAVDTFVAVVGPIDIRAIKRNHVAAWIAAQREKELGDRTISRRMESLSGLQWRWLRDHEMERSSVWTGHKLKRKGGKKARLPFHTSHLEAIESYIAAGRSAPIVGRLLHLIKATGLGPSEAGGLMLSDIEENDKDCPYIWVRDNEIRTLKNDEGRERFLPLVGPALIAVRAAAKEARAANKSGLFFERDEFDRNALSARLNKALRSAGIAHSIRLTTYSYRHTIIAALKKKKTRREVRLYIEGHAGSGASEESYGESSEDRIEMKSALEAALAVLGEVDLLQYRPEEKAITPTRGRVDAIKEKPGRR